VLVERAMQTHH